MQPSINSAKHGTHKGNIHRYSQANHQYMVKAIKANLNQPTKSAGEPVDTGNRGGIEG